MDHVARPQALCEEDADGLASWLQAQTLSASPTARFNADHVSSPGEPQRQAIDPAARLAAGCDVVELNTLAMVLPYVSLRTSAVLEEEEEDDPRKTQVAAHQAKETRCA
ncbi:Os04g0182500 [Oryza sativa Japonica Group]|uniref:Os04g0182500 protein n=1 Tax=Oryza sativa subsp. japonica TaxID=39947 RepID=A0A0P0W739_ORYSJ|nr:Os04g0182500 [Oryza sativa Japonica Group]